MSKLRNQVELLCKGGIYLLSDVHLLGKEFFDAGLTLSVCCIALCLKVIFSSLLAKHSIYLGTVAFTEIAHNTQCSDHFCQRGCSGRLIVTVIVCGLASCTCSGFTVKVSVAGWYAALSIQEIRESNGVRLSALSVQGLISSAKLDMIFPPHQTDW